MNGKPGLHSFLKNKVLFSGKPYIFDSILPVQGVFWYIIPENQATILKS
jgi:hypothetical protein